MFYDVYERLCKEKGEKPYALPLKLGAKSNSMVAQWQKGSVPRIEMLQKIADYFDVSVGYLLDTEKETPATKASSGVSPDDFELLERFHAADEQRQAAIRVLLGLQ